MVILFGIMLIAMPAAACFWRYGSIDDESFARFMRELPLHEVLWLRQVVLSGWALFLLGSLRALLPGA